MVPTKKGEDDIENETSKSINLAIDSFRKVILIEPHHKEGIKYLKRVVKLKIKFD